MAKVQTRSSVLPAGSAVAGRLEDGKINIEILSCESDGGRENEVTLEDGAVLPPTEFGERWYVRCKYPDGFLRTHQIKTPVDLVSQVVNFLRGRYGVESVKTLALPESLDVGGILEMEVQNGA